MTPRKGSKAGRQERRAQQKLEPEVIKVSLHWRDIEAMEFVFADELFARYARGAYWLTFGQVHGPYEGKPNVERLQKEGVSARPVAKIVVTPERLIDFLKKLNGLYDRMEKPPGLSGNSAK